MKHFYDSAKDLIDEKYNGTYDCGLCKTVKSSDQIFSVHYEKKEWKGETGILDYRFACKSCIDKYFGKDVLTRSECHRIPENKISDVLYRFREVAFLNALINS